MTITLKEADKLEILTLQDNYIDVAAMDSTDMVHRALPLKDGEIKNSILAEHGFSALVSVSAGSESRSILFDFGFSEKGAAVNADSLAADLSKVEALVLSHGHMDHFGGLLTLVEKVGKKNIELVLHPTAFLTGADFEPVIEPTTEALKALYLEQDIIPTHCTGRKAVMNIEKEMPDKFLLNMSGTRMVFEGEVG